MTALKRTFALCLPLALAAPVAMAGGLTEPVIEAAPTPVITPAPVSYGADWTGFYAGGQLGYGNVSSPLLTNDADGLLYGVHAGYNYDFGSIVVGGEIDYDKGNDVTDAGSGIELDSVTRLKLRAGYDAGAWMPYVTIGAARAQVTGGANLTDDGAFAGLGVNYRISDSLTLGGEVLQHQFKDFGGTGEDIDATTLSTRISFNF
jgi:predicted porin